MQTGKSESASQLTGSCVQIAREISQELRVGYHTVAVVVHLGHKCGKLVVCHINVILLE